MAIAEAEVLIGAVATAGGRCHEPDLLGLPHQTESLCQSGL